MADPTVKLASGLWFLATIPISAVACKCQASLDVCGETLLSCLIARMARTTEAVAGFCHTHQQGEAAYQALALVDEGFTRDEIGFLCCETRGHDTPKIGPVESM